MTQITPLKVGLIAIYLATVSWSVAQQPRSGTSGSNRTAIPTPGAAGQRALNGNSTATTQPAKIFPSSGAPGATSNAGAHIGTNAGSQMGTNNQAGGITGGATPGLTGSSSNSIGSAQIGTKSQTGTNTIANTNAKAQTAADPTNAERAIIFQSQPTATPINSPSPGNSPTPFESVSPSVTPTPTPTPVPTPVPVL